MGFPGKIGRVVAALSGGADSVYLLLFLKRKGFEIAAAHYHHGLRETADADLEFCRELCEREGIPFFWERGDIYSLARIRHLGIETAAREARYEFLRRVKQQTHADAIALGHHKNDQAETILMHLLRGSGLKGACGMAEREGDLYRPLLSISKRQIIDELNAMGITWREDETNAVCDNPRNTLRNRIIPDMETLYPGMVSALARFAEAAAEDEAFLHAKAESTLSEKAREMPNGLCIEDAADIPEALLRRILMKITGVADGRRVPEMTALVKTVRRCGEFGGFRLEPIGNKLYIINERFLPPEEAAFSHDGETVLRGICRMRCAPSKPVPILTGGNVQVLSAEAVRGCVLRTRRNGDRIQALGSKGTKLLSDYLTDKKIPRPERDILPVLAKGNEILWVVGLGISERAKVLPETEAVRVECELDY